jgi:tripartite-type tricarboxylate transporter receptor subunit TctC
MRRCRIAANSVARLAQSVASVALMCCIASSSTRAESVEQFYRGRTITIYVGTGTGEGAVTAYPMTIAQVISKYIPGHPSVIVSYMPGAGGIRAANFIDKVAPQDGTVWGFITRGFILAPLLKLEGAQFNPVKFNWIGSPARAISVGEVWSAATPVRTIEEATKTQVVVGGTAPNQDTAIFPRALNSLIGTKFKVITGYESSPAVDLAMRRKEVQGKIGVTWTSLNSGTSANWVRDKTVTVIVQLGTKKAPNIPSDVPLALDLTKTQSDRQALYVLCAPTTLGYPSFMGPDVPKDRVNAIRDAYVQTMHDPEFQALLKQQDLDLSPIPADELTNTVRAIYALPESAKTRARSIIAGAE